MAGADRVTRILLGIIAFILVCAALSVADTLTVPLVFAAFIIAIVWPLQRALQRRMPGIAAVCATLVVTFLVIGFVSYAVIWAIGHVIQWVLANVARFQAAYVLASEWLEGHGFMLASVLNEHFDVRFVLRVAQNISGHMQGFASFFIITFVYVLLGLMEVEAFKSQVARLRNADAAAYLMRTGADIAAKFQKYMLVRTYMSVATGLVVWAFTLAAGMELATAWGAIAFAMNYIPFIGPFIATLLPTTFALVQFQSLEMVVLVFVCLNLIQFLSGSYLEPRIAGKAVAVSPTVVLFAIFFFAFLWGLPGAFIGVPVVIAMLTACANGASTRWVADLLSGEIAPESRSDAVQAVRPDAGA